MTTQRMLDDRYGRHPRGRIVRWAIPIAIATVVVVLFGWMTVARNLDAVDADATAFAIPDEHTISVTFQATVPRERSFACALEALDTEHGIVGWRVVTYPASTEHTRAFTETLPTVALATTGVVNACWVT